MFKLYQNPQNKEYQQLIELAFNFCDTFHLVIRRDMGKIRELKKFLSNPKIESSLIERKKDSEWASTTLDGKKAYIYYYNTKNPETKNFIIDSANSLFSWQQPDFPEDLSFFKDGKVWMSTSSHEKECYIYPTSQNEVDQLRNIGLELGEEV
jgi:hypothetical protein